MKLKLYTKRLFLMFSLVLSANVAAAPGSGTANRASREPLSFDSPISSPDTSNTNSPTDSPTGSLRIANLKRKARAKVNEFRSELTGFVAKDKAEQIAQAADNLRGDKLRLACAVLLMNASATAGSEFAQILQSQEQTQSRGRSGDSKALVALASNRLNFTRANVINPELVFLTLCLPIAIFFVVNINGGGYVPGEKIIGPVASFIIGYFCRSVIKNTTTWYKENRRYRAMEHKDASDLA